MLEAAILTELTQPAFDGGSETAVATMTRGTGPGTVLGTAGYMSPEQVGGKPTDHRSDIFGLARTDPFAVSWLASGYCLVRLAPLRRLH